MNPVNYFGISNHRRSLRWLFATLYLTVVMTINAALPIRGVVYDVGLNFGGTTLSVEVFDSARVAYDMGVIHDILRCNTVRIEGESIQRLVMASEIAGSHGLKVFFNPWKHEADSASTVRYMEEAAKAAQSLLERGLDVTFVAGCEYTLFNKGAFPGDTFNDRFQWLFSLVDDPSTALEKINGANVRLNSILRAVCSAIRSHFSGNVTYSSGTWETVDWDIFDIVGIDYYRHGETDEEYMHGVDNYRGTKPVVVMEMGSCAYTGAGARGGEGFAIFQGIDGNGNAIYENGVTPQRNETEQADYIVNNINLLEQAGADGVFIYVFSYPVYPFGKDGIDYDMISYALVKSFPAGDSHWDNIPSWTPKEAFYRLGLLYSAMADDLPNGK